MRSRIASPGDGSGRRAEAQLGRAFEAVKALAGRLERDVRQSYTDGFEAGIAFAVAGEARSLGAAAQGRRARR